MSDDEYEFTEEDMREFNSFSVSNTSPVDDDFIVYDPDIKMSLHRDGFYPVGAKKDMDVWEPVNVERSTIMHPSAYLAEKDVIGILLSDEEEEMVHKVVGKYGGDVAMETIAFKYSKKTGVMNPWYTEFMPEISVLEVCPGSIVVRDRHRSSMLSGAALWCSYIVWLKAQKSELPFNESMDYETIVEEGKVIYGDRPGWGSIGHMYWCFKRLRVPVSSIPSSWTDVYFGREKLGVVETTPQTVIDEIAFNVERAEMNACVVASVHGIEKEYYTTRLLREDGILTKVGYVYSEPPKEANFNVLKEYFYYGKFVDGLFGRVFPVAWAPSQWGLFLCTRNGSPITLDDFINSRKIFKHLMHQKLVGYVTGCSCANCVVEARYGNATTFGKIMMKKMGLFPGHVKGEGYPFITAMLGTLEGKVAEAMNPKECVVFSASLNTNGVIGKTCPVEKLDEMIRKALESRGQPVDRYAIKGNIVCRFPTPSEAKYVLDTMRRIEEKGDVIITRAPNLDEITMKEEELVHKTGITGTFLTFMSRCGLEVSECGPGRYGYKKFRRKFLGVDKICSILANGPDVGMTSYQLKFMVDCDDNVKKIVSHLNALKAQGKVVLSRTPSGETYWKIARTWVTRVNKDELHYNIPHIREKGHRAGEWSKTYPPRPPKPATPKVFQRPVK